MLKLLGKKNRHSFWVRKAYINLIKSPETLKVKIDEFLLKTSKVWPKKIMSLKSLVKWEIVKLLFVLL